MNLFSTQHRPIAINQAVIRANEKTMVQQCHSQAKRRNPPALAAAASRATSLSGRAAIPPIPRVEHHPTRAGCTRNVSAVAVRHQKALFALDRSV
jgi:hypothetical protein